MTHDQDLKVVQEDQIAEGEGPAAGVEGQKVEAEGQPVEHLVEGPKNDHQGKGLIADPGMGYIIWKNIFCP